MRPDQSGAQVFGAGAEIIRKDCPGEVTLSSLLKDVPNEKGDAKYKCIQAMGAQPPWRRMEGFNLNPETTWSLQGLETGA